MGIHPTAIVSNKSKLGLNITVGAFTIIHDNVCIHDNVIIESNCELGVPHTNSLEKSLVIGAESHIRSHSIFYAGSTFGKNLITGHRVTVREKTQGGINLQIGTLSDIQGNCTIGDYVRLHSNVHIGQESIIGNFVWLFPYVVLTNDPHPPSNVVRGVVVEDFAVIATMSVVLPGVQIARHCFIGAHSSVNKNTKDGMLYSGSPAKMIGSADRIRLQDGTARKAYPWTNHFTRGYPEEIIKKWENNQSSGG